MHFNDDISDIGAGRYAHGTDDPLDSASIMEEFLRLLENYDRRRRGKARSVTDLERLVEQVKNE